MDFVAWKCFTGYFITLTKMTVNCQNFAVILPRPPCSLLSGQLRWLQVALCPQAAFLVSVLSSQRFPGPGLLFGTVPHPAPSSLVLPFTPAFGTGQPVAAPQWEPRSDNRGSHVGRLPVASFALRSGFCHPSTASGQRVCW